LFWIKVRRRVLRTLCKSLQRTPFVGAERRVVEQQVGGVSAEVLVVDDDAALNEALKFAMELEGLSVETYPDAESLLGLKSFPEHGCIVIDVNLPGINGLELLRRLRARKVTLPVVLITSNPPPLLRIRAAAADVPIVEKPLLRDELIDTVRTLLAPAAEGAKAHG
jgi:two-component system response regulator FixJ